mmetsp:Transcript_21934/g.57738  ORF Transcript_21934/g.57738 Transcript_21934/m.57738 type:complete len:210 (-) Transcript_21934:528-1157(-)
MRHVAPRAGREDAGFVTRRIARDNRQARLAARVGELTLVLAVAAVEQVFARPTRAQLVRGRQPCILRERDARYAPLKSKLFAEGGGAKVIVAEVVLTDGCPRAIHENERRTRALMEGLHLHIVTHSHLVAQSATIHQAAVAHQKHIAVGAHLGRRIRRGRVGRRIQGLIARGLAPATASALHHQRLKIAAPRHAVPLMETFVAACAAVE